MLPEAQARSLLVGIGPAIPPPTLTGLPVPRQTITQQTWQAAPQAGFLPPAGSVAGYQATKCLCLPVPSTPLTAPQRMKGAPG